LSLKLSVVICSLNGAAGVDRCIRALATQTIRSSLEVILVDDGSTDATSQVGRGHAVTVVRHATNLGLAAARNSGLEAATAPVVAFLDDDCEPEPQWAEQLLAGYEEGVIGVGGPILPRGRDGFMLGFLVRNNPLKPQELSLAKSNRLLYRFNLYLRRQWTQVQEFARQDIYSFAGANMSFRRQTLIDVGRFDTRFRFGAEEHFLLGGSCSFQRPAWCIISRPPCVTSCAGAGHTGAGRPACTASGHQFHRHFFQGRSLS
jgi:glycosyltransferase involved in cell wall biosynthesis